MQISLTVPFVELSQYISKPLLSRPEPLLLVTGDKEVVEKFLADRKKGRETRFMTLMKGASQHCSW